MLVSSHLKPFTRSLFNTVGGDIVLQLGGSSHSWKRHEGFQLVLFLFDLRELVGKSSGFCPTPIVFPIPAMKTASPSSVRFIIAFFTFSTAESTDSDRVSFIGVIASLRLSLITMASRGIFRLVESFSILCFSVGGPPIAAPTPSTIFPLSSPQALDQRQS